MFMERYLGHTCGDRVQTVKEHLEGTAVLSGEFASRFGKRDWGYCCGLLHDIGKTKELSAFPLNDYTDEGQLLGHIYMGAQMINDLARQIPEFPEVLKNELIHCILSHHGELEYGSPKKPALVEAVALNLADNTDARMETITEIFAANKSKKEWLGYNKLFESNLRRTDEV